MVGTAKKLVQRVLQACGAELVRYNPVVRVRLLREQGITLVLDVGANVGQYGAKIRAGGYQGRIVSFEPLAAIFGELERKAAADPKWECRRVALGAEDATSTMNVYGAQSSSLLQLDRWNARGLALSHGGFEEIVTRRLDSLRGDIVSPDDNVFLKLDVQGFELPVLQGAEATLDQVLAVEAELSLSPLYEGQALLGEVVQHLDARGYRLVWLERILVDPRSGYLLQVDGLFSRDPAAGDAPTTRRRDSGSGRRAAPSP